MPDAQVTRRSSVGKWHGVNKDPGLSPYLVLNFKNHNDVQILQFFLEHGELQMDGTVYAGGGTPIPTHVTTNALLSTLKPRTLLSGHLADQMKMAARWSPAR